MKNLLIATVLALQTSVANGATAIKCVGSTEVVGEKEKRAENRIYLINDVARTVSTWDAKSEAGVPYCVHDCATVFGPKHIRLLDKDDSGELVLDIDRVTGAVMDIRRLGGSRWSGPSMETFEGICSKTRFPKSSGRSRF